MFNKIFHHWYSLQLIILMIFLSQKSNAQVKDTTDTTGSIIMSIVLLETITFGMSSISYLNYGSEYLGTVYGISSIGFLTFTTIHNIKFEKEHNQKIRNYELAIPFSIGLAALSYYNFKYSDKHSKSRKFWTNVIGLNSTGIFTFASSMIIDKYLVNKKVSFAFNNNYISLTCYF
jgi:CDP-diglyceride synthetase